MLRNSIKAMVMAVFMIGSALVPSSFTVIHLGSTQIVHANAAWTVFDRN